MFSRMKMLALLHSLFGKPGSTRSEDAIIERMGRRGMSSIPVCLLDLGIRRFGLNAERGVELRLRHHIVRLIKCPLRCVGWLLLVALMSPSKVVVLDRARRWLSSWAMVAVRGIEASSRVADVLVMTAV